ncbi:MAG TPA: SDR family oxidoreductase [Stellaceae bacterium]|jgi:NAD(P)-dependent dehydrogenase (short-subunit alcohol dehydrogenase family)|nr:SDR family oxidoreductase [Stellaceae bacterium]
MAVGMFDLSGKTALVTGSSRGIGRAIAMALAGQGAWVVTSSRKAEACEEAAAAIRATGGEALAIPCHVGDKAQLESLVEQTRNAFGGIDILVNNVGANPVLGPLHELSDEAFDRVMTSNVRSALWLSQLVLPEMAARKDGAVIFLSSIAAQRASSGINAYGAAKAALAQLARGLAAEWGPHNIRVNCIAPGLIKTDFARALWEDEARVKARIAETPLGRLGEPEDIAGVAVLLASREGSFITGQTIIIDGGTTIAG